MIGAEIIFNEKKPSLSALTILLTSSYHAEAKPVTGWWQPVAASKRGILGWTALCK